MQLADRPQTLSTPHQDYRFRIVPAHSATHPEGFSKVRDTLGVVRAMHGEYADFFSGVFSRLESVSDTIKVREQSRDRQLDELRQQCRVWEQERAVLERELEAVRNRAAELSEELQQQKRDTERQQNQWAGELKRIRRTLQQIAHRTAVGDQQTTGNPPAPQAIAAPNTPSLAAAPDPVLDSVMAQFEILQNDVARRRKAAKS